MYMWNKVKLNRYRIWIKRKERKIFLSFFLKKILFVCLEIKIVDWRKRRELLIFFKNLIKFEELLNV